MKASELRIGNIVGFKNRTDCYCTVQEITFAGGVHIFRFFKDGTEDDQPECVEDLTGIPLTEEWLLKFGFKYQDRDVSHNRGKIERFFIYDWFADGDNWSLEINLIPRLKANGFFWLLWDIGGGKEFVHLPHTCKLEFVHQLQNFIYSLTGTELTIK